LYSGGNVKRPELITREIASRLRFLLALFGYLPEAEAKKGESYGDNLVSPVAGAARLAGGFASAFAGGARA
jgi:hypothetical protein